MTFDKLNRRTHLYSALFLLPWLMLYGLSSVRIAHNELFDRWLGPVEWTPRPEQKYHLDVPESGDLRPLAARLMAENGLSGSFYVNRTEDNKLNVSTFTFWNSTQVTYFINEDRLTMRDRTFRWDQLLLALHFRGGYEQESPLNKAWGVTVDVVCVGILVWTASGICMWWQIRASRRWGLIALAAGCLAFAALALKV